MYIGKIIDAHMHFWDTQNDFSWINQHAAAFENIAGEYSRIRCNFLPQDYFADFHKHNITRIVHVEACRFEKNAILETKWLQSLSDRCGFPQGIVGYANLADPSVDSYLKAHCHYPNMRGIRMILNYCQNPALSMTDRADYLGDVNWRRGFALLSKYQLSFDMQVYDHQIDDVLDLAMTFPETTIIIEHFAWPSDISELGFRQWMQRITMLAQCQNVYIKLSAAGLVFQQKGRQWFKKYLDGAIKIFSADKCLFGSNFPVDRLFYDASTLMMMFKQALADYDIQDQVKIFYANALRVYRL